jgi:hypothetical protein
MEDVEYKAQDQADPIERMEAQLTHGLRPVQPDPEFVRRLRNRLANPPDVSLENRPKMPALVVTVGFLTTGIIILWVINRVRRMIFR